jgi:precorrin-6A/cobalt-precorrin-6A reductase
LNDIVRQFNIRAIVDATHPYAKTIRSLARRVAAANGVPYLRFDRPMAVDPSNPDIEMAADHESAARLAFGHGRTVLLTVGTRNLAPYVRQSAETGLRLVVRALDHADSIEACRREGIRTEDTLTGRGPFSLEENRRQLRDRGVGVLVTKDSGEAGGTTEKLRAAAAEGCRVGVVARPTYATDERFEDIVSLLNALERHFAEENAR